MKNFIKTLLIILIFIIPSITIGETTKYIPLAPLPEVTLSDGSIDLNNYLPKMFNLLVGVSAVFAFLVLVFEGFQYIFTDSFQLKADIKGKIKQTLGGLFLVLISYIIIYEINPEALQLKLEIKKPDIKTSRDIVWAGITDEPFGDEETTRKALADAQVTINHTNTCQGGQTQGCTNVGGLSPSAVIGLKSLKSNCGCEVQVTGGTENGHQTHGVGRPQVDLAPSESLNNYLKQTNPNLVIQNGATATLIINNRPVLFTYESTGGNPNNTSTGNHWHASFK